MAISKNEDSSTFNYDDCIVEYCVIELCHNSGTNPIGITDSENYLCCFVCDKHYAELLDRSCYKDKEESSIMAR